MITINADVILANALIDRESVSIRELKVIAGRIYRKTKNLYLDYCMSTITWAVQDQRSDLFGFGRDGTIIRKKKLGERYVRGMFNWRIPKGMRNAFIRACRTKNYKKLVS